MEHHNKPKCSALRPNQNDNRNKIDCYSLDQRKQLQKKFKVQLDLVKATPCGDYWYTPWVQELYPVVGGGSIPFSEVRKDEDIVGYLQGGSKGSHHKVNLSPRLVPLWSEFQPWNLPGLDLKFRPILNLGWAWIKG